MRWSSGCRILVVQGTALWEGTKEEEQQGHRLGSFQPPSWGAQAPGSSELTCSGEMAWPLCSTGPRTGIKQVRMRLGGPRGRVPMQTR